MYEKGKYLTAYNMFFVCLSGILQELITQVLQNSLSKKIQYEAMLQTISLRNHILPIFLSLNLLNW